MDNVSQKNTLDSFSAISTMNSLIQAPNIGGKYAEKFLYQCLQSNVVSPKDKTGIRNSVELSLTFRCRTKTANVEAPYTLIQFS